jgi:oxygen-independent coproporphyrinogen-3 oxidase
MNHATPLFDPDLIRRYDQAGPRYTSYPSADRFLGNFPATAADAAYARRDLDRDLSLYFHIPFCDTLCFYCGCYRIPTRRRERGTRYVDYLIEEMRVTVQRLTGPRQVRQIHLGGGTPTFLSSVDLERLMTAVRELFPIAADLQCSIEVDPRRVDPERIAHLAQLGFNRLSMGVQDFDPIVQQAVNRIQGEAETLAILDAARASGFKSISVDLIYGLPHQTPERFGRTLERIIAFRPDRIAVYNYAHMPDRFPAQAKILEQTLPGPEVKLELLGQTIEALARAGYVYIGMDHFALASDELAVALEDGTLQRNFQGYSTHADCEMLGFGVSAIGCVGGTFLQNTKDVEAWEAAITEGRLPVQRGYVLTDEDAIRGHTIQALMCKLRVDASDVAARFGTDFWTYFAGVEPSLEVLARDGLVEFDASGIRVLPPGRLLIRHVAMAFDGHLKQAKVGKYSKLI